MKILLLFTSDVPSLKDVNGSKIPSGDQTAGSLDSHLLADRLWLLGTASTGHTFSWKLYQGPSSFIGTGMCSSNWGCCSHVYLIKRAKCVYC